MSSDAAPLVSVVTPVHNTQEYLAQCIESVLGQTLGDYEYIIVDNCSADGSKQIARDFAAQDSRIKLVETEELLPQPVNYNFALRQISSDSHYCKMVQADDWIFPDCLQKMIALAETSPRVGIVSSYWLAGTKVVGAGLPCDGPEERQIIGGRDACRRYLLFDEYFFGSPTTVLFRSDLVRSRDRFFIEDSYHEDSEVCFELLEEFDFGFIHEVLSYTRVSNISISTSVRDFQPHLVHANLIMKKYGRRFLSPAEYAERSKTIEDNLYAYLSWNLFHGRGREFWAYYEDGLKIAGDELSRTRLSRMQMKRLLNSIGNPKATIEGLWAHFKRSGSRDLGGG